MLALQAGEIRGRDAHHGAPVGVEAQGGDDRQPVVRAPAMAASVSSTEDMVSIHKRSAPPRASAAACSANASRARLQAQRPERLENLAGRPHATGDEHRASGAIRLGARNARPPSR